MPHRSYAYSRGVLGAPSVVLAGVAAALWWLWPPVPERTPDRQPVPGPRVRYVRFEPGGERLYLRPDLFGRRSEVSWSVPAADEGAELLPGHTWRPPRFLPREAAAPAAGTADFPEAFSHEIRSPDLGRYRPRIDCEQVFGQAATPTQAAVRVHWSGDLSAYEPGVPDFPPAGAEPEAGTARFSASVETDEEGQVAHVFVEETSGHPVLDSLLVKALYRGTLAKTPGRRAGGRVVVEWPRRAVKPSVGLRPGTTEKGGRP